VTGTGWPARCRAHADEHAAPTAERIDRPSGERSTRARLAVDWRAVRLADRACCCQSRPVVIAVLPPSPGRPHLTELLLCGHHYRLSRRALAAAGATVLDLSGIPVRPQEIWVGR
jgi:hypothetical protein